jgi:hypothetical protein
MPGDATARGCEDVLGEKITDGERRLADAMRTGPADRLFVTAVVSVPEAIDPDDIAAVLLAGAVAEVLVPEVPVPAGAAAAAAGLMTDDEDDVGVSVNPLAAVVGLASGEAPFGLASTGVSVVVPALTRGALTLLDVTPGVATLPVVGLAVTPETVTVAGVAIPTPPTTSV